VRHKPNRINRWQQLLSNHVALALKSDPPPIYANKADALPFVAPDMLLPLLAFCGQDYFGTPPKDHVMTLGLDLRAPNNSNPATSSLRALLLCNANRACYLCCYSPNVHVKSNSSVFFSLVGWIAK
jgi:hypothetical protein